MIVGAEEATAPLTVFEHPFGRAAFAIRDYLSRSGVPFRAIVLDSDRACIERLGAPLVEAGLPVVVFPDGTRLDEATPARIAQHFGWIDRPRLRAYDLLVFGAGPAGLSAAVYAASEGLTVAVVEREAVGGQAGSSSLIENYLGFAQGISGAALAEQARQQALSFGAEILVMRQSITRTFGDHDMHAELADGSTLTARAVVCATGVQWRRLELPLEDALEGSGVYYGAGTSEAASCAGEHVYVVGGANSAGQAAMNLAAHAARVTVLVRGAALSSTMSTYLLRRLLAAPNIEILVDTHVAALHGDDRLRALTLDTAGRIAEVTADRLFVCIGGLPNTAWAEGTLTARDARGFLLTGGDLTPQDLVDWPLARPRFISRRITPGCSRPATSAPTPSSASPRPWGRVRWRSLSLTAISRRPTGRNPVPGGPLVSAPRRSSSASRHHPSRRDGCGQHECHEDQQHDDLRHAAGGGAHSTLLSFSAFLDAASGVGAAVWWSDCTGAAPAARGASGPDLSAPGAVVLAFQRRRSFSDRWSVLRLRPSARASRTISGMPSRR